jgi:hypothetical protein
MNEMNQELERDQIFLTEFYKQYANLENQFYSGKSRKQLKAKPISKEHKNLIKDLIDNNFWFIWFYLLRYDWAQPRPPQREIESKMAEDLYQLARTVESEIQIVPQGYLGQNILDYKYKTRFSINQINILLFLYQNFSKVHELISKWWVKGYKVSKELHLVPNNLEIQYDYFGEEGTGIETVYFRFPLNFNSINKNEIVKSFKKLYNQVTRKIVLVKNFNEHFQIYQDYETYKYFLDPSVEDLFNKKRYKEMTKKYKEVELRNKSFLSQTLGGLSGLSTTDNYAAYMTQKKHQSLTEEGIRTIIKKWRKQCGITKIHDNSMKKRIDDLIKQYS